MQGKDAWVGRVGHCQGTVPERRCAADRAARGRGTGKARCLRFSACFQWRREKRLGGIYFLGRETFQEEPEQPVALPHAARPLHLCP